MATGLLELRAELPRASRSPSERWQCWVTRLTWAALLLGIAWRLVRYALQFPVWGDEAFLAINFLDRDPWELTRQLEYAQVAPLLFLWSEWLAHHWLGASELALRLVPLLAGLGGLLLFWRVCRLTLPPLVAGLAVSLLAVSYYPVRHATEIKPYAFDLLMPMILLWAAVHWSMAPQRTRWLVLLALAAPVAIAGSYPAIFVAGAVSLYLLPRAWKSGSWSVRGWYLAYNAAMVATFVAHFLLVGREQVDPGASTLAASLHEYWGAWFPPENLAELPWWLLKAHTGNMLAYPVGGPNGASALTFLLCLIGLWVLRQARRWDLLVLCTAPFMLSLLAAFAQRYPYGGSARLAQHLAPAICMLMGFGLQQVCAWIPWPSVQPRRIAGVLTALLFLGLGGLGWTLVRPYKTVADLRVREAAAEISAQAEPCDVIIIFNEPLEVRANMIWYLRQQGRPIVWQDEADWSALDAQSRRLCGVRVRLPEQDARPPELLTRRQADWRLAAHHELDLPAVNRHDSRQHCAVLRWVAERD